MNFVAIDFETANSNRSSICALGIAMVHKGELLDTAHFLIKPTPNYYDAFNSELHGIRDRHTRDLPTLKEQWDDLSIYFEDNTIVAHNASFDCSALRLALDAAELEYPDFDYHCTLQLSKAALSLVSHTLDTVSKHFKIDLKHHNAESDARAAALIAIRLCEKYGVDSLEDLSEKLGFRVGQVISNPKSVRPFAKR